VPGTPSYDGLRAFGLFVGPNRSGSSLVGALLDAHAQALIAHELDAFEDRGSTGRLGYPDREALFAAIAENSARAARKGRKGRRRGGNVSYAVPDLHQGGATSLRVIGTKRANRTMVALEHNPRALEQLEQQVRVPLRLIYLVRNPFDNVASMTPVHEPAMRVGRYVELIGMVGTLKDAGWPIKDVFLEDVIAGPRSELAALCEFLDLDPAEDYLASCASIVEDAPNESRHCRDWTDEDVATLTGLIRDVPWLARYAGAEIR